jgi:undecaprenyl-diphosphatase
MASTRSVTDGSGPVTAKPTPRPRRVPTSPATREASVASPSAASSTARGRRLRILEPRPGGPSERLAARTGARPTLLAVSMWAAALVLFTAALTGIGLLLVHPLTAHGLLDWEPRFEQWTVGQRRGWRSSVLTPGTWIGSTGIVIGIAFVFGLVMLLRKRIREFAIVALSLTLEASVFGATQYLVERDRPSIPKLEQVAPTASFPSGHTAAAVALYASIAIVASDRMRHRAIRVLAWVWAVVAPLYCITSRLYRGAHHPTDVMASVVLGVASVLLGVWAVRTATAAARRREVADAEVGR